MREKMAVVLVLTLALTLALAGCGTGSRAVDLMEGITAEDTVVSGEESSADAAAESNQAAADFAVRLLQEAIREDDSGGNVLLSPLSVLFALAMTANGAGGETLAQMEEVLGMGVEAWNAYFADFPKREELLVANSVWINSGTPVEIREDFLKMNAGVYSAGIYEIPFDEEAVKEINGWVKAHTDGMIEEILDQISEDTMLYLINAVSFEARWSKQYDKDQVSDGVFTREDGETRTVSMMSSKESFFLEDENAVGFMKYYENANYMFVALLPDEGLSVADYLESLTGERITALLGNLQSASVTAAMPMFEYSYDAELKEVLAAMGMTDAFDPEQADYTGIGTFSEGDDNLFLAEVLHKTSIAVDRNGTRASAVTKIAMDGAISPEEEQREVTLDRPFVYMIVDSALKVPVFIGTVMDPSET